MFRPSPPSPHTGPRGLAFVFALVAACLVLAGAAQAQIVVNEIMQNPAAVGDSDGEWFEIHNAGFAAVDLEGWTVADNDIDSFVVSNGGPLIVPAGGYLVFGNNADSGTNGGVPVDYEYTGMFLANGADELVLFDTFLNEIFRVEYDGGPSFPDPNGASMSLVQPDADPSDGGNWCSASTPYGAGDLGTPGAVNDCVALAPQIVITEIMQNPAAVSDGSGEWFEVYNAGASPVDLDGATVSDAGIDSFVISSTLVVAPGDYVVLGNNADTLTNGGVTVDYQYSGMFLANGDDEIILSLGGDELDRVEYDGGPAFPDPNGASMALIDPAFDNNVGASWCTASTPFGAGDLGTPGAANDCVVVEAPALVIHEILQNPSAVNDGDGEWFEIYNPTAAAVDLDGWTIADNDSDAFVVSGTVLVPAGGYVVLGNNANAATNGGVTVDYQYSGMFLSNSADELVLFDPALTEVDRVEWDNGATFPDPNGASMALSNPALDNNLGASWCTASTPFGSGDLGTPGAANDCPLPPIVINEVDADTPGSDAAEFVELFDGGTGNTALDGLVLVFFNGSSDTSYRTLDLAGFSTDADGYFVAGNAAVSPDLTFPGNGLQNGADAVALYLGGAAAFPDGTAVTTSGLIDAVVYDTSDADDAGLLVLLEAGQPQLDENGEGNKDLHSNQRCPNGLGGQRFTDGFVQAFATPGATNNCGPVEIFDIQGAGFASPFAGSVVSTEDNVVTAVGPEGFFMQTPAARADGDVATSDGIYVFTAGAPGVQVGDLVDVTGTVVEFFDFTEFDASSVVSVVGVGTVPAPVVFDAAVPSPDPNAPSCGAFEYECYEGMLVEIVGGRVTGPNQRFGTDPFAEVHVTASSVRALREPGVEFPGLMMAPIPTWDGNPEVFELDPDKLGLPNQAIPAGSSFDAVGALGYEFGGYELWPSTLTVHAAPLPSPVRVAAADEVTVGSLNLFRLFDDIDDPATLNAVGESRDDEVVGTAEYLRRRAKIATYIVEVLRAPDVLAVQEVESLAVLQDLAGDIQTLDPAVVYSAHLIEGNDVGTIDVGFLARSDVQVQQVTQLGFGELFTFDVPASPLHDRPPLVLEGLVDGTFPITVMALHMRSLGGIEGTRTQQKRLAQAESVAQMVQDIQTLDPNVHLVVTGDFNAYEFTDGYVDVTGIMKGDFDPAESLVAGADLVSPDLTDLVLTIPQEDRYSFVFRGNGQVLDHAMTSQTLDALVTGFEFGRGNADAALELLNDDGLLDPNNLPLRSSDHDGLVTFLFQDEDQDGIADADDVCLGTSIPEAQVPSQNLGQNRYALVDGDGVFEIGGNGSGNAPTYTLEDTAGCSCEQIIVAQDLGQGHVKFGCSRGEMETWIGLVNP